MRSRRYTLPDILVNFTVSGLSVVNLDLLSVENRPVEFLQRTLRVFNIGERHEPKALGLLGLRIRNHNRMFDHV